MSLIRNMGNKLLKKVLIGLGILIALLLTANGVVALVPSVREAITGIPLEDQIFFLADEIDAIKSKQACQEAEIIRQKALDASGIIDVDTSYDLGLRRQQVLSIVPERLANFDLYYNQYLEAMKGCEQ